MFSMLGFFLCLFIVGTFFDLQINEAIFHNKDTFGLVISVLGTIPGYAMFAFIGGGALSYGVNKEYKTWIRVISFISCAGCYFASIYFAGREFFGPNGFYHYVSDLVGFAMMVPVMGAVVYLGFRLTKKSENKNLWIVYLVLFVALVIALVPGTTLLKVIFNRPRFRSVSHFNASALQQFNTVCETILLTIDHTFDTCLDNQFGTLNTRRGCDLFFCIHSSSLYD